MIYICVDKGRKEIHFGNTWEEVAHLKGKKKKFDGKSKSQVYRWLLPIFGDMTVGEIDSWVLPDFIKKWAIRRARKTLYITYIGNTIYYLYGDSEYNVINKPDIFGRIYNLNGYVFKLIKDIASINENPNLTVYTDVAELLKINRSMYGENSSLFIKLTDYKTVQRILCNAVGV